MLSLSHAEGDNYIDNAVNIVFESSAIYYLFTKVVYHCLNDSLACYGISVDVSFCHLNRIFSPVIQMKIIFYSIS